MSPVLLQLLLAATGAGGDYGPPSPGTLESAYYECMVKASERYGRKTTAADDAVLAAKSLCHEQRAGLLNRACYDAYGPNMPLVDFCTGGDRDARRRAEAGVRRIEEQLYPFFIQAALDGH